MGAGYSFVKGLVQGANNFQKSQLEAKAKAAEDEKERLDTLGGLVFDAIGDGSLSAAQGANFLSSPADRQSRARLASLLVKVDDVAATKMYGTGTNSYKLKLAGEMKFGSGTSGFDRAGIFWTSFNDQLSTTQGYDDAVKYFNQNADAKEALRTDVLKNEYELRLGNIIRQQDKKGENDAFQYIDLTENYGQAAKLFDELGFQNVEEDTIHAAAKSILNIDEDFQKAYLVNVRNKDGGHAESVMALAVDNDAASILESLASRGGFESAQEMIFSYNYDPSVIKGDMSDEEFARKQNAALFKAVELEKTAMNLGINGWSSYLASPAEWTAEKSANLLENLKSIYGTDAMAQQQGLALLSGTPSGMFAKGRKYRYSKSNNQKDVAQVNGSELVERITGLKTEDFNEGLKAQEDAVAYIERLQQLEAQLGEQTGTGWIRGTAGLLKSLGIQIRQGAILAGDYFTDNKDFQGGDLAGLADVAEKVGIDLAAISEAEAIRLTLAAKMARAVDPSGRLSNQDFEIQLRRLGEYTFSTPESINAALLVVKKEFEKDLEYKQMLSNIASNESAITRQQARRVQAARQYRKLQGQVFGTGKVQGKLPSSEVQSSEKKLPEGSEPIPGSKTSDGLQIYIGPNSNTLYLPDGTIYIPDTDGQEN